MEETLGSKPQQGLPHLDPRGGISHPASRVNIFTKTSLMPGPVCSHVERFNSEIHLSKYLPSPQKLTDEGLRCSVWGYTGNDRKGYLCSLQSAISKLL